jgi:hypothetical protein
MCFSPGWFFMALIYVVCVCFIIALFRRLIPWAIGKMGVAIDPMLVWIFNLIVAFVLVIAVIYFVWSLVACVISGHVGLPLFPRG